MRQLSGDIVLVPDDEVTVATVDTDVTLVDPYDGFVLNDDGTDVVSLVDPDGNTSFRPMAPAPVALTPTMT